MLANCFYSRLLYLCGVVLICGTCQPPLHEPPNILLAIADDWSWPHASIAGTPEIQTPAFDRIANEGILFPNAFCSAPSCTPSRGALLTGQYHWRLENNANLWSALEDRFQVYPDLLERAGYKIGYTGKGWGPGMHEKGGRHRNPAGPEYNSVRTEVPPGMSQVDYYANFLLFLENKPEDQPFCFWYGAFEPHRGYAAGRGIKLGKDPGNVDVPKCLPDHESVRSDILDYYSEVEWFDRQLEKMIHYLEEINELNQTIIIITSDNGMPFPRCKSNLYDLGTNVPLAIRWGIHPKKGRMVHDFISLTDLAPTILEAAGLNIPDDMTGRSLMTFFKTRKEGLIESERNAVLTGKERHAWVRQYGLGYPMRAIRTHEFLYIYNFEPDRWPAGDPTKFENLRPSEPYGDIDGSPTKQYMLDHSHMIPNRFYLAFLKRPQEELYELETDPDQVVNLAIDPAYQDIRDMMHQRLMKALKETNDPRISGQGDMFDRMPYYNPGFLQNVPE